MPKIMHPDTQSGGLACRSPAVVVDPVKPSGLAVFVGLGAWKHPFGILPALLLDYGPRGPIAD
jgi:hypothetical protein